MVSSCCVIGCAARNGVGIDSKFFRIPQDQTPSGDLGGCMAAINRKDNFNPDNARVCSWHFIEAVYDSRLCVRIKYMYATMCQVFIAGHPLTLGIVSFC